MCDVAESTEPRPTGKHLGMAQCSLTSAHDLFLMNRKSPFFDQQVAFTYFCRYFTALFGSLHWMPQKWGSLVS